MLGFSSSAVFNPIKDLMLHEHVADPAAFKALLAFAAYYMAQRRGSNNYAEGCTYKLGAMRIISERLADLDSSISNGTMIAVVTLAGLEVRGTICRSFLGIRCRQLHLSSQLICVLDSFIGEQSTRLLRTYGHAVIWLPREGGLQNLRDASQLRMIVIW
jgi:hypothetical protein